MPPTRSTRAASSSRCAPSRSARRARSRSWPACAAPTATVPGINIFFQPVQSINIATTQTRAQYQFGMRSSDLAALRDVRAADGRAHEAPDPTSSTSIPTCRCGRAQTVIEIDRDIASRLGLSVDQIRLLLYSAFGTRQVSTIYAPDDTYQVILEVDPKIRRHQRGAAPHADPYAVRRAGAARHRGQAVRQADVAHGQPHRPASGGHDLVQPGARRGARRGGEVDPGSGG